MTGELLVTPQELKNTASNFMNSGNSVKTTTQAMMDLVRGLKSVYEGEAANAYVQQFEKLDVDMQKIHNKIKEHVDDLNEMATLYERTETTATTENTALSSNIIQ